MADPSEPPRTPDGRPWSVPRVGAAVAAAAAVLLVVVNLGSSSPGAAFTVDAAPRPLPDAQLAPASLDQFEGILAGLRGEPVVVNIWASWCAPCRAEMPLLERAAREHRGDVVVLGVDSRDEPGPAADFLADVGVSYPNVFDGTGAIRRALGLRGFPTTYFFDRDGRMVTSVVGGITEARLAAQLDALI